MKEKAKINRHNVMKHLLEYQLKIVNKTIADTIDDDKWYFNWTLTRKQHEEFQNYSIKLLQKIFKFSKKKALASFYWFDFGYGLRVKD